MSDSAALQGWRRRAQGGDERVRRWPPSRALLAPVVTVVVVCALFGGRAVTADHATNQARPSSETAPACPLVAGLLRADVDGDGCDEEVAFADGILTAGGVRMQVGSPGDQVALGRWTCGPATVALLRPASGEVFRFDGWATQANAVPAVALGRVDGAVGLRAAPRGGGRCDDVVVARSSGPPVLLPERPVAG